ncbi:HIG1 domain-containing protein [Novosphingobium lentum]|uniref:HIG1 domain-containing protein n=1 Tax=Novosphingobium lentum TaxID=145287 RepID=UPI0008375D18|nr:HIG1 domain-containing protein [Novosphingobium lentum]
MSAKFFILVPLILIFMGMAVFSLVRGIAAFLKTTREDLERPGTGATESQLMQNRMMFARIKYQALAVIAVVILLAISGSKS